MSERARPRDAAAAVLALLAPLAVIALAGGFAAPTGARQADPIDLFNPLLSPELAGWLIGPYGRMASKEEVRAFSELSSDEDARAFVEAFWARRDPDPERPGNPVRDLAEARADEADRRFDQAGYPGRRTDRGTIFVLHGEPEKIEFLPGDFVGDPPLETWSYERGAERGLDGEKPKRRYRFEQRGDLTVFYVEGLRRQRQRPTPRPFP